MLANSGAIIPEKTSGLLSGVYPGPSRFNMLWRSLYVDRFACILSINTIDPSGASEGATVPQPNCLPIP